MRWLPYLIQMVQRSGKTACHPRARLVVRQLLVQEAATLTHSLPWQVRQLFGRPRKHGRGCNTAIGSNGQSARCLPHSSTP